MAVRRWIAGVAVLVAVLGGAAAGIASRDGVQGARMISTSFRSAALDSRVHFLVSLPAGYDRGTRRYPVVYFLHGLPAGPTSYQGLAWVETKLEQTGMQAILVIPQGTRRQNGDPEYHDWGPGHNWATALSHELPAFVDAHWRTIASRRGRALIGLSAGGYGAASMGLSNPALFSVVESWSGYFEPTDPTGKDTIDLGSKEANEAASVHALAKRLGAQFRGWPTFLAFYVGRSDPTFVPDNVELDRELSGYRVPHAFAIYPGGHDDALWQGHAVAWLRMALRHLARPA